MPFDGNGVYNPLGSPTFPAVPGTTITAGQYNSQINDMAAALSNCITRDGQSPPSTNIPMNNFKIIGMAAPTLGGDAANKTYVDAQDASNLVTALTPGRFRTGFRNLRAGFGNTGANIQAERVWLQNASGDLVSVVPPWAITGDTGVVGAGGAGIRYEL